MNRTLAIQTAPQHPHPAPQHDSLGPSRRLRGDETRDGDINIGQTAGFEGQGRPCLGEVSRVGLWQARPREYTVRGVRGRAGKAAEWRLKTDIDALLVFWELCTCWGDHGHDNFLVFWTSRYQIIDTVTQVDVFLLPANPNVPGLSHSRSLCKADHFVTPSLGIPATHASRTRLARVTAPLWTRCGPVTDRHRPCLFARSAPVPCPPPPPAAAYPSRAAATAAAASLVR